MERVGRTDSSTESSKVDLNNLATQLEGVFRAWAQLEPLLPRPRFTRGGMAPDAGLPRFGVVQVAGTNVVQLDPAYDDVVAGILLREIISTYFPASCLV